MFVVISVAYNVWIQDIFVMSTSVCASTLVYPALMHGKILKDKAQKDGKVSQAAPQPFPFFLNFPNLSRNKLNADQVCFTGNTPSSEGKARDAERAYQRVQSNPRASQKDKEYFKEVSDQQYETSGRAKKYGAYTGMGAGALTGLKGAAMTPLHPVAGPAVAMSSPAVVKNVSERATNFLHDKVFDQFNYAEISEFKAKFDVVEEFLEGKTSAQDGSAYTFDKHGQCHEIRGISQTREQEMQREYEELMEKKRNRQAGFFDDYQLEKIRSEVKRHMVTTK